MYFRLLIQQVEVQDLENAFEQLRELKALRDTILKLEPFLGEKLPKQQKGDGEENDETSETEVSQESPARMDWTQDPAMRNAWMKAMLAHAKGSDKLELELKSIEDDDLEAWNGEEEQIQEEQVEEPLTPEQQEGNKQQTLESGSIF